MKPTLAATTILVLTFVESARAIAAEDARFYPPQGWNVSKQPDGTAAIQPPNVPAGKTCAVIVMPDVPGEVNVVYAMSWKTLTEKLKIVTGGDVGVGKTASGFETRFVTATADAPDTGRAYMHFFAVQAGSNVRRALFIADDKAAFEQHLPAVKVMFKSVGIDPATLPKANPLATPPAKGTGFDGVFYHYKTGFDPAGASGELSNNFDYLCLSPNGRAYNGHPTGGPVTCFEYADDSPSYGTYTRSGDEIIVKWNVDRSRNQQITQKLKCLPDGNIDCDGSVYHSLAACDGLKLDGAYAIAWADGSRSRIAFTKDGRFTEHGLKDCVSLDQLVHPDWPKLPERGGSGTYKIQRNTLEVTYDHDGPTRRMLFTTTDEPTNPKRISIANRPLEREP